MVQYTTMNILNNYLNSKNYFRLISNIMYFFDTRSKKPFYENYNKYRQLYQAYLATDPDYEAFTIPLWKSLANDIEKNFLHSFEYGFLDHPVIRRTMFMDRGGKLQENQLEWLSSKIEEKRLRYLLEESHVGHPTITDFKHFTSQNSIHHLNHLVSFSEKTGQKLEDIKQVVEWGGGYGNMARIFSKIRTDVTYIMIDLPVFSFIEAVYLSTILGEENINVITKPDQTIKEGKINIIPSGHKLLDSLNITHTDLFISTWALSESNGYAQEYVASKSYFDAKHLLIGHQEKSEDIHYPENIMNHLAEFKVLYHEKIPLLKNNYYLFCVRKP